MDAIFSLMSPQVFVICMLVAAFAGMIKGLVGFAMPMILVSVLGSIVGPELALAGLILPTVLTNGWQALRQGWAAAWDSVKRFRLFLVVGFVALMISAQLVRVMPERLMLMLIGVPITGFAALQVAGVALRLPGASRRIEVIVAAFGGFIGGFSGVWGPPTVAYLNALDTPKNEHVRIQGVIYGLGALALLGAHVASGVVRQDTLPFSVALLVPALGGMWVGLKLHDRADQATFRKATALVLLIAGLNLIRRGVFG
ncbi:sulfite exporter TauE/SafE family protein [Pseudooceanicola sp.]|uniref:sulfite exporter TauE/SafE family protein n=1 Tax=Pseudooceanicola sp. TaxID=1914328 RepID=UPI0026094F8E|nr:sulfite exporter TauE/SafE family protein [Pseudooceanicola sp.]MDF1855221.1 sulfite exporter TauE/SafE family protein [Pseudooceanicola sp.]